MKAVILEKLDSDLTVGDVELTPLQYGQVLVKNLEVVYAVPNYKKYQD